MDDVLDYELRDKVIFQNSQQFSRNLGKTTENGVKNSNNMPNHENDLVI